MNKTRMRIGDHVPVVAVKKIDGREMRVRIGKKRCVGWIQDCESEERKLKRIMSPSAGRSRSW